MTYDTNKQKAMMTKMMTIRKLSFLYVIVDVILIAVSLFAGGWWLINTQLAFIGSMLITFASFFSYKIMIEKKIDAKDYGEDNDAYDKLEDPYNLFEEDEQKMPIQEAQDAKKPTKLRTMISGLVSGISGALSLYRALAYGVLFIMILFLIRHDIFAAVPFFIGLSVVPVVSLLSGFSRH
ncbi:hypothetical protein [Sulfurospirillum sp. 1612]|uniref:hypothetical protein n=1 Tax=Sulfurospirillum sp. 1612 TaxID=3094835 RepID=UPI002F957B6C